MISHYSRSFMEPGWKKRITWNLREDYALNTALKKSSIITMYDKYNFTIRKSLVVTPHGFKPVYRVLVWADYKGVGVEVIIDVVNGTIPYEEKFVIGCTDCDNILWIIYARYFHNIRPNNNIISNNGNYSLEEKYKH